jgi:hypothetical protein
MVELVLQNPGPGRYASGLLYGKYQIVESFLFKGQYHILDLEVMFSDDYLGPRKAVFRHPAKHGELGDRIIFSSVEEAEAFLKQVVSGERPTKLSKRVQQSPSSKPKSEKEKRQTMAGMTRDLILAGGLTDDQIYQRVLEVFPTFRRSSVDWYRKELIKKGLLKA